jgi:hypothetical protein
MSLEPIDPVSSALNLGNTIISRIFPDPAQADQAKLELLKLQQSGELASMTAQTDINKEEAKSTNWFVAGARPFILWICGFAMLYCTLIEPILRFVATVLYGYTGAFPVIDSNFTMQVMFGILGLGAMRSYEKKNNVESNR